MENPAIIITLNLENLELSVDAPTLTLDVVISILQRAMRQCENAEKVVVAQQVSAAVRGDQLNEHRTKSVLSRIRPQ